MPNSSNGDPLGYLDELREALDAPDLQHMLFFLEPGVPRGWRFLYGYVSLVTQPATDPDDLSEFDLWELRHLFHTQSGWDHLKQLCRHDYFTRAAYAVLRYYGYCRLFGVTLPLDLQRRLPRSLLLFLCVPASVELLRILKLATDRAELLPKMFDQAEPFEDISHCTSMLHLLMQTWATSISFEEAFGFYVEKTGDIESKLAIQYDKLLNAFRSLDLILQGDEHIRLLSVAVDLPLLENWRLMLGEPFRQGLPWWLNGCLEEVARSVEQEIRSSTRPLDDTPRRETDSGTSRG